MRTIDADALEKTIVEEFHGISATGFIRFMRDKTPIEVYNKVRDLIDNAPTVERKPFASVTFDKDELEQIVRDRVIEPIKNGELVIKDERPQGEWIPVKDLNNFIRTCREELFEKMKDYHPREFEIRENMLLNFEQIVKLASSKYEADIRGNNNAET